METPVFFLDAFVIGDQPEGKDKDHSGVVYNQNDNPSPRNAARVFLMDESNKSPLELLAKLAQQLASLQRECNELRRELDDATKVQQEQLEQLAALKAKYDQLCRERDAFRKALEEQLTLNPAFCVMPDPNTEH
ncbi:MAG: hypothetical protein WCB26_08130 [Pseudolabrys sp.]